MVKNVSVVRKTMRFIFHKNMIFSAHWTGKRGLLHYPIDTLNANCVAAWKQLGYGFGSLKLLQANWATQSFFVCHVNFCASTEHLCVSPLRGKTKPSVPGTSKWNRYNLQVYTYITARTFVECKTIKKGAWRMYVKLTIKLDHIIIQKDHWTIIIGKTFSFFFLLFYVLHTQEKHILWNE